MPPSRATPLLAPQDPRTRFVRLKQVSEQGMAEFAFGIGSADLMVDLVMPLAEYHSFCRENAVVHLTREQEIDMDHERSKWRYGQPGVKD